MGDKCTAQQGAILFHVAEWVNPLSMHVYSLSQVPRIPRIESAYIGLDSCKSTYRGS